MILKAFKALVVTLLAVAWLGSTVEAAPKKTVRRRPPHSTRVTTGTTATRNKVARKAKHRVKSAARTRVKAKTRATKLR